MPPSPTVAVQPTRANLKHVLLSTSGSIFPTPQRDHNTYFMPQPNTLMLTCISLHTYTDQTLSTRNMSQGQTMQAKNQGVTITETRAAGHRVITEAVGGEVLGQRVEPDAPVVTSDIGSAAIDGDPITIGEALEAVVISDGDKPVDQSDAAAITVAEIRATGDKNIKPGGVGERAQSAATLNSHVTRREDMTRLSDVLTDATERLPVDKPVTKEDAEAVYAAEAQFPWRRDTPEMMAEPGGVAASMATAARLNDEK